MIRSLELGSGQRPEPGFIHTDITRQPGVKLDWVGPAWLVPFEDDSMDEVLALGVMEHLPYLQFELALANVRRMLTDGGVFLFDVPDLAAWCRYLADNEAGFHTPFDQAHILQTLYGWQRWEGDEHKSGWTRQTLSDALTKAGFHDVKWGVDVMLSRGYDRRRMHRPEDAHLYVECR